MSPASAADRRHARSVELAMEARVASEDQSEIDEKRDAAMKRARTFCGGLVDTLREERALDALADHKRERVFAILVELAGLLDGATPVEAA